MEAIIFSVVAAIVFAMSGYLKSAKDEEFDVTKFATTVLVGALVGVVLYVKGAVITEEAVATQFAAYAGIVVIVENALKAVMRWFQNA
ncbi:hypothetical protein DRN97_00175 [Methanosarcinales archaeon]|nr:MAG: hypothetical protein DRN97_00175 [Methanosarcinales archaeon]